MRFYLLLTIYLLSLNIFSQKVPFFVEKVYNDIYKTMDNGMVLKPEIVLSTNRDEIASFYPLENKIEIGLEFVKLARTFKSDSSLVIAHILSHELAHVILQQNDFIKKIGSGYASKEYNQKLKKLNQVLIDSVYERQADEYAMFFSYMSGYKTSRIAPLVLDSIYSHFHLRDKDLSRYPSLLERKLIVSNSVNRFNFLSEIFDFANLSLLSKNQIVSKYLLQTIVKEKFPSHEIYNNLGLVYLLNVINHLDKSIYPYYYPCEIDFKTNLSDHLERGDLLDSDFELNESIRYFDLALKDENYSNARINKAIAELLSDKKEDFQISLLYLKKDTTQNIKMKVKVLEAIFLHQNKNIEQSLAILKSISDKSVYAKKNLRNLNAENTKLILINQQMNEIKWIDSLKNVELPQFDFFSNSIKSTDSVRYFTRYEKQLSIFKTENEHIKCDKIMYRLGGENPTMYVYSFKKIKNANKKISNELIELSDSYFNFLDKEYVKFDSLILEFNNSVLSDCYLIK